MKLRYRRLIYLSFIAAFLIITPLIITIASGYRFNFKKNIFEKTGILYLASKPRGAMIFINGKYLNLTPNRFTDLLPDIYQVEVSLDNYYPWQKELEVKSNLTTFSNDIILFKKSLPVNITEGEINILQATPNEDKILFSFIKDGKEEIRLLNTQDDSNVPIKGLANRLGNKLEFVSWSPDKNKVLLLQTAEGFNRYLLASLDNLTVEELNLGRLNFQEIGWDETNDNFLYGLSQSTLYQINLAENTSTELFADSVLTFQSQGNDLYYVSQNNSGTFLNKQTWINGELTEPKKIKLPPAAYSIQLLSQPYLILQDEKSNDFFVIDTKAFADENIDANLLLQAKAKKIIWSPDAKKILYYSDFEISTFDPANRQVNLITRYGKVINDAVWYWGNKYMIYQVNNSIHATEICCEDKKNDIVLANLAKISNLQLDATGKYLYFFAQIGHQQGLYRLDLQ